MALIHCPECRIEVSSKAPSCPKCAYPLSRLTSLPEAILKGDVELVEDIVKSGADVNAHTKNENTPLFIAAATGDCRIIQSLLNAGALPQAKNEAGETPLDIARKKRKKQAIFLLQAVFSDNTTQAPQRMEEEGVVRIIKKTRTGEEEIRDFRSTSPATTAALNCTRCAQPIGGSDVTCPHCKVLIVRRYCASCKKLYPDHAQACPHCGASGEKHFRYYRHPEAYLTVGIALLIFSIAVAMNWYPSAEKQSPRAKSAVERLSASARLQPKINKILPVKPVVDFVRRQPKETSPKITPPAESEKREIERQPEPSREVTVKPNDATESPQSDEPARANVNSRGRALNDLGYRLLQSGQAERAIPILYSALKAFPKGTKDVHYGYALFNLGRSLRLVGRPDLAIPVLEQRLKLGDQRLAVFAELEAAKRELGYAEEPEASAE